jgi:hypothetical protein
MEPCRLVVLFPCYAGHSVQTKRDESGRPASLLVLSVQFVRPNRIERI